MSIRIVVDSTADIPVSLKERITVVPLNVNFGDEQYVDGVTIQSHEFYEKLAGCKALPTTSQPSPEAFAKVFEEAKNAGDTLVVLTLSSRLSGTCQSAMIAAQDYPENVYIVDTEHVANGFGVLAEYAVQMVDEGKSAQEIVDEIRASRDKIVFIALLDTLTNLQKGGRIPKSLAIAGTLLSLKPILTIKDGVLETLGKARGIKQGYTMLNKEVLSAGVDFDKPILLAYSGLTEEPLEKYLAASGNMWQAAGDKIRRVTLCSVVGAHAGPGAVVVACFKK